MGWIQTYTGVQFWPLNPSAGDVNIEDIAHALSMICRFNGHTKEFYSVAEHSVWVSKLVEDDIGLHGLLHDSAEAYISDMGRPIKSSIPGFRDVEIGITSVVSDAFNINYTAKTWRDIKEVDFRMLETERLQLMGKPPVKWSTSTVDPYDIEILCLSPQYAKRLFLERFEEVAPSSTDTE